MVYYLSLQVHDPCQLLNSIQEQIPLLNHFSVLRILEIGSVGDNDTSVLVNLGRETIGGNESTRVMINESRADAKGIGHGLEGHGLVGIEELLVGENVEFAHPESGVGLEVTVLEQDVFDFDHGVEVGLVIAVVVSVDEFDLLVFRE
jgi:hypothetical protein